MAAIRSTGNKTETKLRKAVHAMGLRYRKYSSEIVGKPDFMFPTERVVVFVDGDYWHGRVLREKGRNALKASLRTPTRKYWLAKFERNVCRDDFVSVTLRSEGWIVMRFWESDIKSDVRPAARKIAREIRRRRAALVSIK